MPDTERPALTDVITAAIEYARQAGYDIGDITPADFGLQTSPAGYQFATWLHVGDGWHRLGKSRPDAPDRMPYPVTVVWSPEEPR